MTQNWSPGVLGRSWDPKHPNPRAPREVKKQLAGAQEQLVAERQNKETLQAPPGWITGNSTLLQQNIAVKMAKKLIEHDRTM